MGKLPKELEQKIIEWGTEHVTNYDPAKELTSYGELLEIFGGVKVLSQKVFGTYQGDYLVVVRDKDGEIKLLDVEFGSCDVCDDLMCIIDDYMLFDDKGDPYIDSAIVPILEDFAKSMLKNCEWDVDGLIDEFRSSSEWDVEADEVVRWLEVIKTKFLDRRSL